MQDIRRWQGESLHCCRVGKESSAIKVPRRCTGQGRVLESQDTWRTGARRGIRKALAEKQKSSQWAGKEGALVKPVASAPGRFDG